MKETGIIMSGNHPRLILDELKTMTRRVVTNTDIVYGLTDDRIYGILILNDTKEDACGRHNFIEWNPIEVNPCLTKRRLYGGVGWADLLTNKIQGLWEEDIRGLVSVKRTQQRQGLPDYFYVSPESQGDQECSQVDLYGISWVTAIPKFTDSPLGRRPNKQPARESSMGNSGRELDGQEGTRPRDGRGEALGIQTDQLRETSVEVGNPEGVVQPTPRRKNTWDVPGFHIRYSPFQGGMRLWVRGTWAAEKRLDRLSGSELGNAADCPLWFKTGEDDLSLAFLERGRWRSSRFMPRWASRITLEITEVRVERLNSITRNDAIAEGVLPMGGLMDNEPWCASISDQEPVKHPEVAFARLWDSLNAKRGYGWEVNPWVWVISFQVVE